MPQCCHSSCQEQMVHSENYVGRDIGPGSKQWGINPSENCQEDTVVLKQVVERGKEETMSPEGLSYPKVIASVRKEVDSKERHSAV
ncbi:hypothetical protein BHE74_00015923 [Ensete ventricosum]|nr:hypothetical protein BHE74_00015923 [Ensete ventricosum]